MTQGRPVGSYMLWTLGVLAVAGTAVGQTSWAERARATAAARLARAGEVAGDRTPPGLPMLRGGEAGERPGRRQGGETAAPRLALLSDAPVFQLAAGPETAPADEAPVDQAEPGAEAKTEFPRRGPRPDFFHTLGHDLLEAPKVLWHDTKATYGNPWNLAFLVGAGGASLALRPEADDDLEDKYRRSHTFPKGERDTFDLLGNPAMGFAVAGLMYVAGQTLQEAKTYEVSKRAFSALIITDLSDFLLKLAANTHGPNGENFAWPSGHMASTMALATVLNEAYGPVVGLPAYGATAFLGIERLDSREHHLSDVVFGTALGWVVAETVMKEHAPEVFGGEIVPYWDVERATAGVAWVKPLDN